MFRTPLLLATASVLALTACVDPNAGYGTVPVDNSRTKTGAVTGAVIGGLIGATAGGDDGRLGRTVVGAGLGAIAGGAIGNTLDRQAAELRGNVGGNTQIVNTGTELRVVMPQDILFATDSATLRPDLTQDLRAVAQSLLNYPNSTVQVVGHTDNVGAAAYNQDLSQRRANSVAAVLRDYGVPSGRIVSFGRGEDAPIADNLTAQGRAQNRRVEIIIRPNA
jgi:outer membrane protein OmpA-like peptidoglycan-associated protein